MKYHFSVTKFEWDTVHEAHAIHFKMNTYVMDELHEECDAYTNKQAAVNWLNSNRLSWFMFMFEDWIIKTTQHFSPNSEPYALLNSDVYCTPREKYLQDLHKVHHQMHGIEQTTPLLKLQKCITLFVEQQHIYAVFIKNLPVTHILNQNIKYLFDWSMRVQKESRTPILEAA
jgi:hypothetical protein